MKKLILVLLGLIAMQSHSFSQTVTGVSVNFKTTTDDKDDDTGLDIIIKTANDVLIADKSGQFGKFGNNTENKVDLDVENSSITRNQVASSKISLTIFPNGHDTWNFNYDIYVSYSDGSQDVYSATGLSLSEKSTNTVVSIGN